MKKSPNESWLFYLFKRAEGLARNKGDWKYWANVFSMVGAACLAVAFIQSDLIALYAGLGFCFYGLRFNRKGDE